MLDLVAFWVFYGRGPAFILAVAVLAMFLVLKRRKRQLTTRGAVLLSTALIVFFLLLIPATENCLPTIVVWLLEFGLRCWPAAARRLLLVELVIGLGVLIAFTLPKKVGGTLEHDEAEKGAQPPRS